MKIAVVGAGATGLSAAYQLTKQGHQVVIFEQASSVSGLARSFPLEGTMLDCYYRHVFTHDETFLEYTRELGLEKELQWLPSKTATFFQGALHPFMGPLDLLTFPHLSLLERIRFGIATLLARRLKDYRPLERVTAEDWLIRLFGENGYRVIWEPLMKKKFEHHTASVSASWIWGKIALRGSSRKKNEEKELLGYMKGSFQVFFDALAKVCQQQGAAIRLGACVTGLRRQAAGWEIALDGHVEGPFDQVLLTTPPETLASLAGPFLNNDECERIGQMKSQAVIVAVLQLDRRLTDYYWVNVNDYGIPFGGLIEHTNLVSSESYNGHIVYLSRYISPEDPLFQASEREILDHFSKSLPLFNAAYQSSWVKQAWVYRDRYAQPVIECGYPDRRVPLAPSAEGLFLANMHSIYPEDRGINYALALGVRVSQEMVAQTVETKSVPAQVPAFSE